jgi:glycosyltransferase involved in cell wall biosynthesis
LPRLYLEHDPPCGHPTNTEHIVKDPDVCLIHVTSFNNLMWNNLVPMVRVIDHGIIPSATLYTGELNKGLVIVNNLYTRGRKLGADIFEEVKQHVPLDLIGMGTKEYGGLGEVLHPQLPAFTAKYRFLFNPIRYTSLGLAVLEAMMNGLPVVALGTTEYTTVIRNGYSGFIDTNMDHLITQMKQLLAEPGMARSMGLAGRSVVEQRFSIDRFTKDWEDVFHYMIANHKKNTVYEKKYSFYQ